MIKIEALYTEACNLYGDRFNVTYLEKSLQGQAEFIYTSLNETPRFVTEDVDMIYIGCTTESKQEKVIELLQPHKERIAELIEKAPANRSFASSLFQRSSSHHLADFAPSLARTLFFWRLKNDL